RNVSRLSRIAVSSSTIRIFPLVSGMNFFPRERELQAEVSSPPRLALYRDSPRVLLNDAVGHRQTQPCSLLLPALGGEERIVDSVQVLGGDPFSRIDDLRAHNLSARVSSGASGRRADGKNAAGGHCVARV